MDFKKIIKIAICLMLIAGISGALIVAVDKLTAPIIEENNINQENKALQEIYSNADFKIVEENVSKSIVKVSAALENGILKGYVYRLSGKNAYGVISLLVGINKDGTIEKVVFLENGQSFASKVTSHVDNTYQNGLVNSSNISDVDTKCGATYGAKLVKSLITDAINHFDGGLEE